MKIHNGNCRNSPCERAHAYKCRSCGTWFPAEVTDWAGRLQHSAYYPYCSYECYEKAYLRDPGFQRFYNSVNYISGPRPNTPLVPSDNTIANIMEVIS